MELYFCDQCEKRIDNSDIAQAKADAPANNGRMLCAACRPKPVTASAPPPSRSTARMERTRTTPAPSTPRASESNGVRRAVVVPIKSPARGQPAVASARVQNSSTRVQPAPALAPPSPAKPKDPNRPLKIGLGVSAVCLLAAMIIAFGSQGSGKKDVAQSTSSPSPPPPPSPAHNDPTPTPAAKQDPPDTVRGQVIRASDSKSKTDTSNSSTTNSVVTAGARDLPLLNVSLLKEDPPTIDGNLDKPVWNSAETTDATKLETGGTARQKVRIYVMRNETNLYIGAKCFEDEAALKSLKTNVTANGVDAIWEDDSVEIFLDPTGKRKQYYHMIINSKGYHWDAFDTSPGTPDKTWKSQVVVAAKVCKDCWTVEVSIPFSCLDRSDTFESEWAFNILHTRAAANELIYWSPVLNKSSHKPERFGRLNGMPKK